MLLATGLIILQTFAIMSRLVVVTTLMLMLNSSIVLLEPHVPQQLLLILLLKDVSQLALIPLCSETLQLTCACTCALHLLTITLKMVIVLLPVILVNLLIGKQTALVSQLVLMRLFHCMEQLQEDASRHWNAGQHSLFLVIIILVLVAVVQEHCLLEIL